MNGTLSLFTPNRVLSKNAVRDLVVLELAIVALVWAFSPFVYLPKPRETLSAFLDLWTNGLGSELVTSLILNVEALAIGSVLSLLLAYSSRLPFMHPVVVFISKLRFLSMAGLAFLFTLVARNGQELKLYLLVFSVSVFFVTGMADVIASIPQEQYDLALQFYHRALESSPPEEMKPVLVSAMQRVQQKTGRKPKPLPDGAR